jgi:WD40 repeat protein
MAAMIRQRNVALRLALLLVALCGIAYSSPFAYGDVFLSSNSAIFRYNQSGTLLQTINGAGLGIAFDPEGNLYGINGTTIQKFDSSGNPLGAFISGLPGFGPTDIDFDSDGNAYIAGIQDLNFDYIRKYSSTGSLLLSKTIPQTQDSLAYLDATNDGRLLVGAGASSSTGIYDAPTLNLLGSLTNPLATGNGGIAALSNGGALNADNADIYQFNSAGSVSFFYNPPISGIWTDVTTFTPTNFWAVTDQGEVRSFDLGDASPVSSFQGAPNTRHIALFNTPEPATALFVAGGLGLVLLLRRKRGQ